MDNPLKNIFSNIKIFNGSGDRAVGVDIGSSAIKVVEIKKKAGRVILETYGSVSLGPYADVEPGHSTSLSPEKIIEVIQNPVLKQKMRENGLKQAKKFSWEETAQKTIAVYQEVFNTK